MIKQFKQLEPALAQHKGNDTHWDPCSWVRSATTLEFRKGKWAMKKALVV